MGRYNVALRCKPHVEGYAGVVTWTSFKDEAEFEKWNEHQKDQEVLGHGITEDECVALVRTTPAGAYVEAAYFSATDPNTGEINNEALRAELVKADCAIRNSRR